MSLSSANFNEMRLDFTIPGELKDFQLNFTNIEKNALKVGYNKADNTFFIDRRKSGKVNFEPSFGAAVHKAPAIEKKSINTKFSIFMDESSIEFFVNDGETVLTDQIFPDIPFTALTFTSKEKSIAPLKVSKIRRIWD